ncbi:MAG: transcription termination/antitermination NusG family protein [Phycisphaerales bacterium]
MRTDRAERRGRGQAMTAQDFELDRGASTATVLDAPAGRRWKFDPADWERDRHDAARARWQVLHTRSRQEKAVADLLQASGSEVFLPLVRKVRYYGHRRRVAETPLFPSYLFLWGPVEAAYPAIASKRAVGAIKPENQELLDRELLSLRLALDGEADLDPFPYLEAGRPVRVIAGPFRGVEGVVEERRSVDRLILRIQTLGRATALDIDPSLLEPLD